MAPTVAVGTSGYSYTDWVGPVYPEGTRQSDFLKLYAREFGMTELNFTYYRQPERSLTKRMVSVTGERFLFAVKAHKTLTHEIGTSMAAEAQTFIAGIGPIVESGKLGTILLQFPFSFHYTADSRRYLDALCREFGELPLALEFRNSEWQRQPVYDGLRQRGLALVNVDEPDLSGLLRPSSVTTSPTGYVRFHGRNKANWWDGDNTSRYDYLYSDEELSEWIPRIADMAERTRLIMVAFNNHFRGQAVRNARRLKELLGAQATVEVR